MKEFDPNSDIGAVPSPCSGICTMDPASTLCKGCLRTLDEIVQWSTASEQTKRAIWHEILLRREHQFK